MLHEKRRANVHQCKWQYSNLNLFAMAILRYDNNVDDHGPCGQHCNGPVDLSARAQDIRTKKKSHVAIVCLIVSPRCRLWCVFSLSPVAPIRPLGSPPGNWHLNETTRAQMTAWKCSTHKFQCTLASLKTLHIYAIFNSFNSNGRIVIVEDN